MQRNPQLVDRTLYRVLEQSVTLTWRLGWQPADLVRYALRQQPGGRSRTRAFRQSFLGSFGPDR